MKREIIPGRFILLISAAFLAIMVLPIVPPCPDSWTCRWSRATPLTPRS